MKMETETETEMETELEMEMQIQTHARSAIVAHSTNSECLRSSRAYYNLT